MRLKVRKLINIKYVHLINSKRLCLAGLRRNLLLVHIKGFILTLLFLTKVGKDRIASLITLINILNNTKLKF